MNEGVVSQDLVEPFLNALRQIIPASVFRLEPGALPRVIVPARNPDVGDLVVYFDDDEITVEVGRITHRHFPPSFDKSTTRQEKIHGATNYAVEFIRDVLADKICVRVYHNSRAEVAGCAEWYVDEKPNGPEEWPTFAKCSSSDFFWSGKVKDSPRI